MCRYRIHLLAWSLLASAACSGDGGQTAPTTANPLARGVECDDHSTSDESDSECQATFDDCSDGLTYELRCRDGECDCLADGDKLGEFDAEEGFSCDLEISEVKVRCGWNPPAADGGD